MRCSAAFATVIAFVPLLFRECEGDGRAVPALGRPALPGGTEDHSGVGSRLGRAVDQPGHVLDVYRAPLACADDQLGHVVAAADERAGRDLHGSVAPIKGAGGQRGVCGLEGLPDFEGAQAVPAQPLGIELDAHLAGPAAEDFGPAQVGNLRQPGQDFLADPPELRVAVARRVQCESDNRDIVDLDGLDDPAADPGRDEVDVRVDLVVELDEGALAVLADEEPDGHDGVIAARDGIDVLDPVDLPEELLERGRNQLLDFGRTRARELHENVRHGHGDLRILFPRRGDQCERAQAERDDGQQDREVRLQEAFDDPIDDSVFAGLKVF